MSILLNGDCLEELINIEDNSIDLIFCDLPYGQTSCSWDSLIDLDKLWIEFMRIKKLNTPIIMTCTTKFGVSLINSAPKKCPFRYDLVWCKSASAGFLSAKKMPLRKHEMIYVFYEKLPFYDLSSHKHKFIKDIKVNKDADTSGEKLDLYGMIGGKKALELGFKNKKYEPPLPNSLVSIDKEESIDTKSGAYGSIKIKPPKTAGSRYDPPLPDSLVKTDKNIGTIIKDTKLGTNTYDTEKRKKPIQRLSNDVVYDPPLPNSLLEVKSTRGKHSTEKPVNLMSWILKYYSKEGDTILDPTMGSGSMGVACKEMNRNFIGIEKDPEIYEVAVNRIEN